MIAVRLVRCDSYTLIPTIFVRGKVYQVTDEKAKELLSKTDDFGISYFEQVDLNLSSQSPEEAPPEESVPEQPVKKSTGKVTI